MLSQEVFEAVFEENRVSNMMLAWMSTVATAAATTNTSVIFWFFNSPKFLDSHKAILVTQTVQNVTVNSISSELTVAALH